jgi:iron complex outermembrane receptor protein
MQDRPRTTRSLRRCGAVTAAAAALTWTVSTTPASAAEPEARPTSGLDEIVVTARRRAEALQDQPLSVTAISTEQLETMNIRRLDDLTTVANVNFNNQPGFVNAVVPFIRGIGEQDPILTNDQPVAMFVDGVLIPRAIGALLDLIEPERIEVLRGPQGSLFGRNTTGGAVIITLPQPKDDFGVSAKIGYASDDEVTLRAVLDTGLLGDSGLKARLAVQRHTMDGYIRNTLTSDGRFWPGSDETTSTYFGLFGNLGESATFDFRADYSRTLSSILSGQLTYASQAVVDYFSNSAALGGDPFTISPNRLDALPIYAVGGPRSDGYSGGASVTFNVPVTDQFEIKSITAYRRLRTNTLPNSTGQGYLLGPVVDPVTFDYLGIQRVTPYQLEEQLLGRPTGDLSRQKQISQEFQFSGTIGENHNYVAGLYAFQEKVSESYLARLNIVLPPDGQVSMPIDGGLYYKGKSTSYAVYASDTFTPSVLDGRLELTAGLRYTWDKKKLDYLPLPELPTLVTAHHQRNFSKLSGDFTAKYRWTDAFMTYFRYANAYKSGGFSGRDDPLAPGYGPETAQNFEVGLKSDWLDRRVRLNAAAFYTLYEDKQITTFAPGLGSNNINASHVVNAGEAEYPGVELELTVLPTTNWQVDVTLGRVWPTFKEFLYQPTLESPVQNIKDDARFPYFSELSYAIGTQYTIPLSIGELTARVDFSHKSAIYFHPSDQFNPLNKLIKSEDQELLSASINLTQIPLGSQGSEMSIGVYGKNLLDKKFRTQGVDYQIIPDYAYFSTHMFTRPRVLGVNVNVTF